MKYVGNVQSQANSEVYATASGTLPDGKPVVVNSDGTVSVVASSSISQALGSAVVFESAGTTHLTGAFDSANNRVVFSYRDGGNSGYGTAVVGTVSGTSISFGTPVVFNSGGVYYTGATFDSNASKVVIVYRNAGNSNYGTAIVGTVSGTTVSFGTAAVFESATSNFCIPTFDSNSNKVVVAYSDAGNSYYGTAVVATVSGTNISFGTPVVFEAGSSEDYGIAFDSNSNKVVIGYKDAGNSNYGTAIVGTVSGTGISFGTAVVFHSAGNTYEVSAAFDSNSNKVVIVYRGDGPGAGKVGGAAIVGTVSGTGISFGSQVVFNSPATYMPRCTFDSNANKVVIAYKDSGNSDYSTLIVGTVSGTGISFGSAVVFDQGTSPIFAPVFDSTSNKVVIGYKDGNNNAYGTGIVFQNASTNTNITTENFVGITNGAYATGQTATIQAGGAVNTLQTGLTAGQQYFVQTDGTLGLTAADPSVIAGTAVSATDLIVKG